MDRKVGALYQTLYKMFSLYNRGVMYLLFATKMLRSLSIYIAHNYQYWPTSLCLAATTQTNPDDL